MTIECPSIFAETYPDLCRTVDHYCERTIPGLGAEPVNTLTNVAFLIGAWLAWRLLASNPDNGPRGLIKVLIVTMATVGLGSFLFHAIGVRWAEWGDVIPILAFMLLYFWLVLTHLFQWPWWKSLAALIAFFSTTFYLESAVPGTFLWGGAMYIPTILSLIGIVVALHLRRHAARSAMLGAVIVFFCAYAARTLDPFVCPVFPLGTHFLWHLLNAALLYLFVRLAILYAPPAHA